MGVLLQISQPHPEEAALLGGRLEGWMHGTASRPSFETRRKDAALLRTRSNIFHSRDEN
jgi:hypothetical protein